MPHVGHPWRKHFYDARFIVLEVDTSVMIILAMSWNTSTTAQVWLSWFCHKFVMDVHAWQKTWPTVTNTYHHGSVFFCSGWCSTRPPVSRKKGKGKKGNSKKNSKQVVAQVKKPKSGPKPETECFYCKGTGHWKQNCPKYLADKKDGKVNKGIFDIHVIDVYLTSVYSNPSVFDTSSVAKISNSKRELQNKQRLVKGEVTMCVGSSSKIDMIIIAHSLYFRD